MDKNKKSDELIIANEELAFQNEEKEKRAAELIIANIELAFQNDEKEKRAKELIVANKKINELEELLQNNSKEISDYKYAVDESSIIAVTDQKGIIKKVNNNFCKISKYSEEELIGQDHRIINSGYHAKEFIRDLWLTITNGKIWRGELKNKAKGGSFYWVDTTIVPFLNDQGKPYQYLALRADITARKETEEYLIQRTAQLETANKELVFQHEEKEKRAGELIIANKELVFQNEEKEKQAIELSIANKELEAFTYVSSHDLQEPLRKIQTFIGRITENEGQNFTEKDIDYFHRIREAANRMQTLIIDLLSFSRLNTAERKFEITDLNIIVEDVKTELADTIEEKHAFIEATGLCKANIITFQFHQLMHNLISNALKFSNPDIPSHILIKSRIALGNKLNNEKLSPKKNYCHITIKDNGIGFEPHFSERIFEVFQKLHGNSEYTGTGIGLAIVKKIVENHNGIITATSELNKGATFDIYIPG